MEGSGTALFTDEELLDALTVTLLPLASADAQVCVSLVYEPLSVEQLTDARVQ